MSNDKAFTIFALALVAAVLSVITASVMAGIATVPTFFGFVEHLFFTVGFRAAYKSLAGPGWLGLPVPADVAVEAEEVASGAGQAAGAVG